MRRNLPILLLVFLGACQLESSVPAAEPSPTPFPEIATTPAFQDWAVANILAFREDRQVAIGLGLEVMAPSAALQAVERGERALLVSSGDPPPGWFSTPLAREPVVIAVNRGNHAPEPSIEQLAQIFAGRISNWEQLDGPDLPIEPVIPLRGDPLRVALGDRLLGDVPFTPAALLGPSPEIMLSLINEHTGAIGILPLSATNNQVRLLAIEGIRPSAATAASGSYPFWVDLLGSAPQEPEGVLRDWLVWLQSQQP